MSANEHGPTGPRATPNAEYVRDSHLTTDALKAMAKGPTSWPAWVLRCALSELVARRLEEEEAHIDS